MKNKSLSKNLGVLLLGSLLLQSCAKNEPTKSKTEIVKKDQVEVATETKEDKEDVVKKLQTEIISMYRYPSLTVILIPKADVQEAIGGLIEGGGKLIYDPNNRVGSSIPFFIAELTADQINDTEFMKGLNLKAASIDSPDTQVKPIQTKVLDASLDPTNFIPTDSVGIQNLVGSQSREELGEGINVAVIDTGVDASHPGFNGRVNYWYDATEETKTKLTPVELDDKGAIKLGDKTIQLPESLPKGKLLAAILSEKEHIAQLSASNKKSNPFLDINLNKKADEFLVVAVETEEGTKILYDVNGSKSIENKEETPLMNYNDTTQETRSQGMVKFPSRNNIIQYPLLLEKDGEDLYVTLGKTGGMHGTHVAGIIAANDPENNLVGAAPKANIMALKVCTQISCTDAAIIKALYKSFYNEKGIIPDVVNISLGSHERYHKGVYSMIFDDLSAKFGTVFFVSASNSGPGFRTLNHIGNTGAVVTVGANVSKKTLDDQYNLPDNGETQDENMLFFSSLGPSYTSEMKPNIVAPGGAVSTVLTAEGYMSQANGTSMSSPLAAGTMAAILGSIKKEDETLFEKINELRELNSNGNTEAKGSLLPYVYAMRDALQQTATDMPDLTRAQQGYGLINAYDAKNTLSSLLSDLNNDNRSYFEVVINDYKESYERKKTSKVNAFKLTIGEDGERPLSEKAKIQAKGVKVVLDRVEILNTDGTVEKITDSYTVTEYFNLVDLGDASNKLTSTKVVFNNRRNTTFYSKRNLDNMETGKTYLAHYKIMSDDYTTVQNILDVVHRPYKLKKREVSVPAINPRITKVAQGYSKKNVDIKLNTFHRYPVKIDSTMNHLKVQVALAPETNGRLYVQVYSPEGKEASFQLAQNSTVNENGIADIKVPVVKKGKKLTGVWEVTISTSSSGWLSDAKYDILVQADSFGAEKAKMSSSAGQTLEVPVRLGGNKLSETAILSVKQLHKQSVKVKSGHMSLHPLVHGGSKSITLSINDPSETYWGQLNHSLYIKKDGKFEALKSGYVAMQIDGALKILFIELPEETVYYALDTITNYDLEKSLATATANSVEVHTKISVEKKIDIKTSVSNLDNFDVAVVKVQIPADLGLEPLEEGAKVFAVAKLANISGDIKKQTTNDGEVLVTLGKDSQINTVNIEIAQ